MPLSFIVDSRNAILGSAAFDFADKDKMIADVM